MEYARENRRVVKGKTDCWWIGIMRQSDLDSIVAEYERAFCSANNADIAGFVPEKSVEGYSEIVTE